MEVFVYVIIGMLISMAAVRLYIGCIDLIKHGIKSIFFPKKKHAWHTVDSKTVMSSEDHTSKTSIIDDNMHNRG